jgi:hypothetical protein
MKNHTWLLSLFALTLTACASPQQGTAAAPVLPVSADGLFTGSAENLLVAEESLGGNYVRAFIVDRVDLYQEPNTEIKQQYAEAAGLVSHWQVQFVPKLGIVLPDNAPIRITNSVTIYSSTDGPYVGLSPNWAGGIYQLIDQGEWTQLPDISGLGVENLVVQKDDGTIFASVLYRNISFSVSAKSNGDTDALYVYVSELVKAHLAWIQSLE